MIQAAAHRLRTLGLNVEVSDFRPANLGDIRRAMEARKRREEWTAERHRVKGGGR